MQEQIYGKVRAYVKKNQILEGCVLVVAGISGGGDSMAMLDILQRLSGEYGFALRAVHVNHGIRGEEAFRDQRFVEEACRLRNIPCSVYFYSVPQLAAKWKSGLEEAGRRVRQEAFFSELGKWQEGQQKKSRIALAHNKNDLAETMLHHLCRGSGLRGLAPMEPEKKHIIRPVLCLERREIDQYRKERKLSCVLDSTNLEDEYTRNRIRHHILPVLEKEINERAVSHMAETAELLGQAEMFLAEQGRQLADACRTQNGSYLFGDFFLEKPEILQKYAVREAMEILAGSRKDFSVSHVKQVLFLAGSGTGASADLPRGLQAERDYQGILLKKKKNENIPEPSGEAYHLPLPGVLSCPLGNWETKIFSWTEQKIFEKKYTKWFDYDRIKDEIQIRTRKTGDFLTVNREGQHKKLSRCMIDEKIPRKERDSIPLAAAGNEILWILGGRINERYKITSETKNVLEINYQGGNHYE